MSIEMQKTFCIGIITIVVINIGRTVWDYFKTDKFNFLDFSGWFNTLIWCGAYMMTL
jgi:hypothetical protein